MSDTSPSEIDWNAVNFLVHGFQVSRIIRLAADLGLADRIEAGADRPVAQLAAECAVDPGQLLRVLRTLAAVQIFAVSTDGRVSHTARSLLLRAGAERSLHLAARFWAAPGSWRAWEALDVALTGAVPHEAAWQAGRFAYLAQHADEARIFDSFMASMPDDRHAAVAAAYDFSAARTIVDIGGGNGELLRQVLARFPLAHGIVVDRADVVAAIPETARADGRIAVQPGDFFQSALPAADHYVLVRVLHDWPDEACLRILGGVRAAMGPEARLLVVETLLDDDPSRNPPEAYLLDMQMMAMFGGARERTEGEMRALLLAAGLAPIARIDAAPSVSILSARAA